MAAPTSALTTLEQCFSSLTTGPGALAIDGKTIRNGLPPRAIPLDELRDVLREVSPPARVAAVKVLVHHARAGSPAWLVGLAGVLLPGLRLFAVRQSSAGGADTAETQALGWFRAALATRGPMADARIQWLLETSCAHQKAITPGRRLNVDDARHVGGGIADCGGMGRVEHGGGDPE